MAKGVPMERIFLELSKNPEFRKADRAIKPRFDIVEQITVRRFNLGMSQADLAEKANTHQSRISKIESADYDFRLSTLVNIAEALGCEVCIQLIPFSEDRFITIGTSAVTINAEEDPATASLAFVNS